MHFIVNNFWNVIQITNSYVQQIPTIVILSTKEQFIRILQSANRILSRVMFCYVFCMSNTYLVLIKSVGEPTTCLFLVDRRGNLQNNKHKDSSLQTNPISLSIGSRGGVESNWTNFELIFFEFFELFFTFRINRIINYRSERISNECSIWKIWLHPIVGIESNRTNFELIFSNIFCPFESIESNRTNFNLTPPLLVLISSQIKYAFLYNNFQFVSYHEHSFMLIKKALYLSCLCKIFCKQRCHEKKNATMSFEYFLSNNWHAIIYFALSSGNVVILNSFFYLKFFSYVLFLISL